MNQKNTPKTPSNKIYWAQALNTFKTFTIRGLLPQLAKQIGHTDGWEYSHIVSELNNTNAAQGTAHGNVLNDGPTGPKRTLQSNHLMGSAGRGRIAGKNSRA